MNVCFLAHIVACMWHWLATLPLESQAGFARTQGSSDERLAVLVEVLRISEPGSGQWLVNLGLPRAVPSKHQQQRNHSLDELQTSASLPIQTSTSNPAATSMTGRYCSRHETLTRSPVRDVSLAAWSALGTTVWRSLGGISNVLQGVTVQGATWCIFSRH